MKITTRLIIAAIVTFCVALSSLSASATDLLDQACTPSSASSAICKDRTVSTDNPLTGTNGTLYKVTIIISIISGVIAVIMIMVSGFRYITSGGDAQKISSAKNTLVGAIIGLVVIVLARVIITFVLSKV